MGVLQEQLAARRWQIISARYPPKQALRQRQGLLTALVHPATVMYSSSSLQRLLEQSPEKLDAHERALRTRLLQTMPQQLADIKRCGHPAKGAT